MAAEVLYITFDGVLQPLGSSQVVRVLIGLAHLGVRYHLLSVERPSDLANRELVATVNARLSSVGIRWTTVSAASMRSPGLALAAFSRVVAKALAIVYREDIRLVHARAYQSALVAHAVKRLRGTAYVFDARGYWIEERSGPGHWFSDPRSYASGKFVEQTLFRAADAVVTLTELQAADLASGLFGRPPRLLEVIPPCTDYDAFCLRARPAVVGASVHVPEDVQRRLAGKIVIGVVGALNDSYLVKDALTVAKLATEASPSAHVLVLSVQQREYAAAIESVGIPSHRCTLATVSHWAMPEWLQWVDWGLLLLPETAAKRASMPTKLGEFFASGVRPMFFGCNTDAMRWVERAGSGYVLPSTDAADLRDAAHAIVDSVVDAGQLGKARDVTASHFGLASGLDRYHRLLRACLGDSSASPRS